MSAAPGWQVIAQHLPTGKTWIISGSPPDQDAARAFLGAYLSAIGQALDHRPSQQLAEEAEQNGRVRLGDLDFWVEPADTPATSEERR